MAPTPPTAAAVQTPAAPATHLVGAAEPQPQPRAAQDLQGAQTAGARRDQAAEAPALQPQPAKQQAADSVLTPVQQTAPAPSMAHTAPVIAAAMPAAAAPQPAVQSPGAQVPAPQQGVPCSPSVSAQPCNPASASPGLAAETPGPQSAARTGTAATALVARCQLQQQQQLHAPPFTAPPLQSGRPAACTRQVCWSAAPLTQQSAAQAAQALQQRRISYGATAGADGAATDRPASGVVPSVGGTGAGLAADLAECAPGKSGTAHWLAVRPGTQLTASALRRGGWRSCGHAHGGALQPRLLCSTARGCVCEQHRLAGCQPIDSQTDAGRAELQPSAAGTAQQEVGPAWSQQGVCSMCTSLTGGCVLQDPAVACLPDFDRGLRLLCRAALDAACPQSWELPMPGPATRMPKWRGARPLPLPVDGLQHVARSDTSVRAGLRSSCRRALARL